MQSNSDDFKQSENLFCDLHSAVIFWGSNPSVLMVSEVFTLAKTRHVLTCRVFYSNVTVWG